MKRIIILLSGILLIGSGCIGSGNVVKVDRQNDDGYVHTLDWDFGFNDGNEWVAYDYYWEGGSKFGIAPEGSFLPGHNISVLQNVREPLKIDGYGSYENLDYYDGEDWIALKVYSYGPNGTVPPNAELYLEGEYDVYTVVNPKYQLFYFKTGESLYEVNVFAGDSDFDTKGLFEDLLVK